jgi:hypothetical protein
VKEFLEKPPVWSMILHCTAGSGFNAHISLLRATLLRIKQISRAEGVPRRDEFSRAVKVAVDYASLAEDSTGQTQVALLDELEGEVQYFGPPRCRNPRYCRQKHCIHIDSPFLLFAVQRGLMLYVKAKLGHTARALNERSCVSLLEHALFRYRYRSGSETICGLPLRMLDFLLQEGLDPNESSEGSTPWRRLLEHLHHELFLQRRFAMIDLAWVDACKLFLYYGANPFEVCGNVSALDIIRQDFLHLPPEPVAELEAMLTQRGAVKKAGEQDSLKRKRTEYEQDLSRPWKSAFGIKTCDEIYGTDNKLYEPIVWKMKRQPSQQSLRTGAIKLSNEIRPSSALVPPRSTYKRCEEFSHPSRGPYSNSESGRFEQEYRCRRYHEYPRHSSDWQPGTINRDIPRSRRRGQLGHQQDAKRNNT